MDKLETLLGKIKQLERELLVEVHKKEERFSYEIRERKIHFTEAVIARHKRLATKLTRYLYDAKPFSILSAPMILFCLVPVLFMDVVAELYQFICFPVYGIPKVRRKDYVVMDRRRLAYLNPMEKWNCVY